MQVPSLTDERGRGRNASRLDFIASNDNGMYSVINNGSDDDVNSDVDSVNARLTIPPADELPFDDINIDYPQTPNIFNDLCLANAPVFTASSERCSCSLPHT